MIKCLFLALLSVFLALPVKAATIDVDCLGGGDSLTVAGGIALASAGDDIVIHECTYNENGLVIPSGNSTADRTTMSGADGEATPIIDAQYTAYDSSDWADSTFFINGKAHIEISGLDIRNGPRATIVLYDSGSDDIIIHGNTISIAWDPGETADDNAGVIYLHGGNTNIEIYDNTITTTSSGVHGIIGFNCTGLWEIYNNEITVNCVDNKDSHGIFWKHNGNGANQAVIKNNIVHTYGDGTSYNGGIWIANDNTLIQNNLVWGSMKYGLRINVDGGDPGGDDSELYHNTVYGADRNGIDQINSAGTNTTWRDNIFYGVGTEYQAFGIWVYGSGSHGTVMSYNLYYNSASSTPIKEFSTSYNLTNWKSHYGGDAGSIQDTPVFVNAAAGNFRLDTGSPGEDVASDGIDMGVNYDYLGIGNVEGPTQPITPCGVFFKRVL